MQLNTFLQQGICAEFIEPLPSRWAWCLTCGAPLCRRCWEQWGPACTHCPELPRDSLETRWSESGEEEEPEEEEEEEPEEEEPEEEDEE